MKNKSVYLSKRTPVAVLALVPTVKIRSCGSVCPYNFLSYFDSSWEYQPVFLKMVYYKPWNNHFLPHTLNHYLLPRDSWWGASQVPHQYQLMQVADWKEISQSRWLQEESLLATPTGVLGLPPGSCLLYPEPARGLRVLIYNLLSQDSLKHTLGNQCVWPECQCIDWL